MSILRKWLGFNTIGAADEADPIDRQKHQETAKALDHERQELRQKLQRQQSASRVFGTAGGALAMMEKRRGRNQ